MVKRILVYAMIATAVFFLLWSVPGSIRNVGTNEVGVSVSKFSGAMETYGPGNYILPRLFYGFYTLETRQRRIEMVLPFKTREGNDISQKLNLTYNANSKQAKVTIQDWAISMDELDEVVIYIVARTIPRDILGDCETTDYYNTSFRMDRRDETKRKLNEIFSHYFDGIVTVSGVNLEEYDFTDEEYKDKIKTRKNYDQATETTHNTIRAQQQFYASELERIEGSNKQKRAQADGEYRSAEIDAKARFYAKEQNASATMAEADNWYAGQLKQIEALKGSGGQNMVRLRASERLKDVPKILIGNTGSGGGLNLQTMDVNKIVDTFGKAALAGIDLKGQKPAQATR